MNVVCVEDNCSVFDCERRHPVICNYLKNFKRCKFSNCSYNHSSKIEADNRVEKIKMLENKIVEIEKGDKKKTIDKKIEAVEKSYEQKIETLNTML